MQNESYTLETILANFEASWAGNSREEILQILTQHRSTPDLLEELIHADLELRLKGGEAARIEYYLESFPELKEPQICSALLKTEYAIRRRREPELDFSEYVVRFPDHYPCLLEITPVSDWESQWKKSRASAGEQTDGHDAADTDPLNGEDQSLEPREDVSYMSLRFSAESIHASGGLGNIWLAHDHELNRKVALKEIRNKHAGNPALQARFIQEAMITGALDHPGVAPVYSLSRFRDGRPYYAMRLVRGATLAERIRAFHENETAGQSDLRENLEFRRLIGHFLDACNTIEYAHSRGVVHRDIKPGNILIGEYGETLVVDWGLAKLKSTANDAVENDSVENDAVENGQATVKLPIGDSADVEFWANHETTSYGDVVGSPAFMSPEQAAGNPSAVGFLSDVYSLGATLYTLLTDANRPAPEYVDGVMKSLDPPRLAAGSMAPLMSICRKAMSEKPGQRYQSPAELKENVERFLANLPVDGHRESVPEKFGRLLRRHSMLVRMGAVALFLTAMVATIAAIRIDGERNKANDAAERARVLAANEENARKEAERSAQSSRNLAAIVNDILLYGDGPANRGHLPSRDQYIEKFEDEIASADAETQMRGLMVLGQNESRLGDHSAAREYYQRAMQICRETVPATSADYLDCLSGLLAMTLWSGQSDVVGDLSIELISLVESSPEATAGHRVSAYSIEAEIARDKFQFDKALDSAIKARDIAEQEFGASDLSSIEARNLIAGILVLKGSDEDLENARRELDELENLVSSEGLSETRAGLSVISTRGHLQISKSRFRMAAGVFRHLVNVRTRLFGAGDPETLKAARSLGDCQTRAALAENDSGKRLAGLVEAIETLEQTRSAQQSAVGMDSIEYGTTLLFLGNAWRHQSRLSPLDDSTYDYRSRVLTSAIFAAQDRGADDSIVLRLRNVLGTLHLSVKETEKALEQYRLAEEGWNSRLAGQPDETPPPSYDQLIVNYANLLQVNGEPEQARQMLERLLQSHADPQTNWYAYLANSCFLGDDLPTAVEAFEPVLADFQKRSPKRIGATEFHVLIRVLTAMEWLEEHESAFEICQGLRRDRAWQLTEKQHCELCCWRHMFLVRSGDHDSAGSVYARLSNSECSDDVLIRLQFQQLESLVARDQVGEADALLLELSENSGLSTMHQCLLNLIRAEQDPDSGLTHVASEDFETIIDNIQADSFLRSHRGTISRAVDDLREDFSHQPNGDEHFSDLETRCDELIRLIEDLQIAGEQ
ncbi:MAG: serine/threonine-protein kinase [Planctomycetota bacterium]